MHYQPNDVLLPTILASVTGAAIPVPDPGSLVHLQFRRFAGCPICNTHLHALMRRADDIKAAGVREVVFFHSPGEDILRYDGEVPFDLVADPDKTFYKAFGVESSWRSFSLPGLWAGLRGAFRGKAGRRAPGGKLGLPADFLIAPTGKILAAKYGRHAYDQWSAEELLALAKNAPATARR